MSKVTVVSRPNRIAIASKGVQGAPGPQGEQGIQGPKGDTGDVTPEAIAARDAAQEAAAAAEASAGRLALANTGMLAFIAGTSSLETARVVDPRDGGYWQWQTGDVSALVAADPYGAFWRPPAADPSGASGAWMRIVDNGIFDAEWVLPDVMPANAQVRINALISSLPPSARKFLLPSREITVTGSIMLSKGLVYEGAGAAGRIDGGGGAFFPVIVAASHARLRNISSGNVEGQLVYGEAGGFHVYDGGPFWNSDGTIVEDVSAIDCRAFDAETGFRCGLGALNLDAPGGTPTSSTPCKIYPSRGIFIENFRCERVHRIGIECMRSQDVEIIGGDVGITHRAGSTGFTRGVRIAGAHNVKIMGVHAHADDESPARGISIEHAGQGGNYGGSGEVDVIGNTATNCQIAYAVDGGMARNIAFKKNRAVGRRDSNLSFAFYLNSRSSQHSQAGVAARNIQIEGNDASGISSFLSIEGGTYHTLYVSDNTLISNASSASNSQKLVISSVAGAVFTDTKFLRNTCITPGTSSGGAFRMPSIGAGSEIEISHNRMTQSGSLFVISGDAAIYAERGSNKAIPASTWASSRPPLALPDYEDGDAPFM